MNNAQFNKIPPRCDGRCGLTQQYADANEIVISKKCPGPSYGEKIGVDLRVAIEKGDIVSVEKVDPTRVMGDVACRNPGVLAWYGQRMAERYGEGKTVGDVDTGHVDDRER